MEIIKRIKIKKIEELEKFSNQLVKLLKTNSLLLLSGEIGIGKTTLTKMLAKHLKIKEEIKSPSFCLLKQYKTDTLTLNHFDLFRISKERKLITLLNGLKELTDDSINIVEWAENDPKSEFWFSNPTLKTFQVKITRNNNEERELELKSLN